MFFYRVRYEVFLGLEGCEELSEKNILEGIKNPLSKGFLKSKKGIVVFNEYQCAPSEENLDKLNKAFKYYYMTVRYLSYFSKTLGYEAKHYDKKRRTVEDRFSLVLDAPIAEDLTMKDAITDNTQDTSEIQSEIWEDTIISETIKQAIKLLTERQKEVINYSFFREMKDKEIAKKIGISPQSVSQTKQAALKKLRRELNIG